VTIFYNQTDVTNNYNILYSYGTLRVTPRPITVCPSDASKIYDGTPLYASEAQVVEGSLASPTHSLQATFAGSRTNVYDTGASRVSSLEIWENGDTKVTKNYTVTLIGGSLNIDPRPIKITSDSAEKIYDGKPLTCKTFSVVVDEKNQYDLVEGHTIRGTASGSQTKIGKSDNVYSASSVKIYNGSTNVTANYIFAETAYGTLEVKPIGYLVITAASDSKVYDGKPLTNSQFTVTVVEGEILNGHSVTATVKGSITEVGKKDNVVVSAIVRNASGSNVTDGYIISTVNGVLEVLDGTGGSGGSGGAGGAGSDSSESGPPGGGEDEGDHKIVVGKVKTDISTTLYLRENSYGVYNFSANGNGGFWKASPSYAALLDGKYGYNYLTSFAMANSGAQSHTAEFSDMLAYMLPYYIGIGGTYTVPTTDTAYSTISKTAYSLKYYTVDGIYSNLSAMKGSLGSYSDEEQKYRAFVYSTYLDIDSETLAYMQSIITQQGFDVSDKHIIEKVAKYIQGAAKYNLKYDKNLDRETNVAIAFLNEYKEGVCVHYATAGTLLFRALGIPARYVEGFTVDTKANEFVDITTPGHAWVEIYIDSIGWIPVEVTGGYDGLGGSSGNGGSGGDMEDMLPHEFEIQPYSYSKEYDGKPLYPGNEIEEYGNLKILLDAGYTYTVSLSGKQTSVGSSPCKVASFVLFDPEGKDVTNEFAITYLESTLKVSRHLVKVYLYEITKYYDGKLLEIGRDDYEVISGLPDGGELVLSLHLPSADVCEITRSELNTNMSEYISYTIYENGKDVSTQYDISFEIYPGLTSKYVPISILACPITITSSSATKVYDGKALTSSAISITVGTLVDGHVLAGCANGSAIAVGSQYNTIQYDSVNITDKNGNDMTDNYDIIFALGKLTILDAD
jgi:transglutaminase-like putative cysteine protease